MNKLTKIFYVGGGVLAIIQIVVCGFFVKMDGFFMRKEEISGWTIWSMLALGALAYLCYVAYIRLGIKQINLRQFLVIAGSYLTINFIGSCPVVFFRILEYRIPGGGSQAYIGEWFTWMAVWLLLILLIENYFEKNFKVKQ